MQEYEEDLSNMQSVKIFGKNYDIQVDYEKIKTPELNLKENYKIQIVLPIKYKKIGNEQVLKMSIEKMYEQIAENEIEDIMEKTRKMLGFAPEDYEVKIINGKIAKCEDGKITINPELMKYKRETIEYVIAHEFCHLKYKTHCKSFNDKTLIFSDIIKTSKYYQRDIYNPSIKNEKLILLLRTFKENKIFYANDMTGTDFKQVIDFEIRR